jgi:hypothetical protein
MGKSLMLHAMRLLSISAKDCLSNGLGSLAFFLIAVAILAGGCKHSRSKDDGANTAVPVTVSELSPSLAGKRITVRGKLFMFKCGQGIGTEDGHAICLVNMSPKPSFDDPFAGMSDKPLEVTGTLRFFHDSIPLDASSPILWQHDHYYFEKETTQVRIMTEYIDNATVSSAGSQLSQALVGKRITVRGKLFMFKCGGGIQLDDEEAVCLEQMHPKPIFRDPYSEMYGKRVEATGTLRFYHDPTPIDETTASQRVADHYYFEYEITQVRLVPNHDRVKPHKVESPD